MERLQVQLELDPYSLVLEISGQVPGNDTFHELANCVLLCKDKVIIRVAASVSWFWFRFQEAVSTVFRGGSLCQSYHSTQCTAQYCLPLLVSLYPSVETSPDLVPHLCRCF